MEWEREAAARMDAELLVAMALEMMAAVDAVRDESTSHPPDLPLMLRRSAQPATGRVTVRLL